MLKKWPLILVMSEVSRTLSVWMLLIYIQLHVFFSAEYAISAVKSVHQWLNTSQLLSTQGSQTSSRPDDEWAEDFMDQSSRSYYSDRRSIVQQQRDPVRDDLRNRVPQIDEESSQPMRLNRNLWSEEERDLNSDLLLLIGNDSSRNGPLRNDYLKNDSDKRKEEMSKLNFDDFNNPSRIHFTQNANGPL